MNSQNEQVCYTETVDVSNLQDIERHTTQMQAALLLEDGRWGTTTQMRLLNRSTWFLAMTGTRAAVEARLAAQGRRAGSTLETYESADTVGRRLLAAYLATLGSKRVCFADSFFAPDASAAALQREMRANHKGSGLRVALRKPRHSDEAFYTLTGPADKLAAYLVREGTSDWAIACITVLE